MSLRVLIVEDDADQRQALRACLRRSRALADYKLRIEEAADGVMGLERFRARPVDVVIVDLLLPKLDGLALCNALRAEAGGAEAVVVAISGAYRDARVARRLWEESRVELLTKPLDLQRFGERLRTLLDRRQEGDPAGAERWLRPSGPAAEVKAPAPGAGPAVVAAPPEPQGPTPALTPSAAAPGPPPALLAQDPRASTPARAPMSIALGRPWQGELGTVPLAAWLVAAAEQRATGVLTLARAKLRKVVYLETGSPVYVDSNLRHEALGSYLVETGVIDEAQLEQALRAAKRDKCRLGEALVAQRALEAEALKQALAAQVQVKLAGALRWDEGQLSFAPGAGALVGIPRYPIDTVPWLLAALDRLLVAGEVGARIEALADGALRLTAAGRARSAAIGVAYGQPALELLLTERPLRLLLEAASDRDRWLVRLAALLRCGLVEPAGAPAARAAAALPASAAVATPAPTPAAVPAVPRVGVPAGVEAPATGVQAPVIIPDALGAELLYRQAVAALEAGDTEGALSRLHGAVAGDPSQPDYHALLGWVLFLRAGGDRAAAERAVEPLARAFTLHPDAVLAHELAARIAERMGDRRRAAEHLAAALKQAPQRTDLLRAARPVLGALGDFAALERLYRLVLGAARGASGIDLVGLWLELATLYSDRLGRPDHALVALGVAEGLAGADPRVREARRALGQRQPPSGSQ